MLPTPYAWESSISVLTEGDCRDLVVALPCRLTSLGITIGQTVVLLLLTLHIVTTMANLSSWFPVFLRSSGCGRHIRCSTHESRG